MVKTLKTRAVHLSQNQTEVYGRGECLKTRSKDQQILSSSRHIGCDCLIISFNISIFDKVISKSEKGSLVLNDIPLTDQKYLVHELLKQFDTNSSDGAPLTSYKLLKIFL